MKAWNQFIANADDDFSKQMATILSEALAKIDTISDEELERLVDCE